MIATNTTNKKIRPIAGPSASVSRYCRPIVPSSGARMLPTAISANRMINPPSTNDATSARRIALGALRCGSTDSSPSDAAVSNPYMTYEDAMAAIRNAPR